MLPAGLFGDIPTGLVVLAKFEASCDNIAFIHRLFVYLYTLSADGFADYHGGSDRPPNAYSFLSQRNKMAGGVPYYSILNTTKTTRVERISAQLLLCLEAY
ncbi:hypothetical protein EYR41_000973 [Orbilia oligospora]|uniref:Uncharacterized protein n=1 Tax=Orbilia oligospora TaxID=2813651 RepID=A0A8H2E7D4_ORBOL|nr:hypothetical protein EYR41_000973 [Orbilia oligospora]